jgi:hypothetical protein
LTSSPLPEPESSDIFNLIDNLPPLPNSIEMAVSQFSLLELQSFFDENFFHDSCIQGNDKETVSFSERPVS